MRTFVILAAGALLFAAAIVELSTRLWPESHLALLLLAVIALLLQGWLGSRLLTTATVPISEARPRQQSTKSPRPSKRQPARTDSDRESGTVKWFNRSKGFGFIVRDSGDEIFVHQRSIQESDQGDKRRPSLRDGQSVTFVVVERDKGKQAEDVAPA